MATDDNPHRKMIPAASEAHSIDYPSDLDRDGKRKLASFHAKLILGSYRVDQANDPEIYVTAIAHLLSRYDPEIGAKLTDPKDGIAGKCKWLPTVSEVKEEADRIIETRDKAHRRVEDLKEQWQLRDEWERQENAETPEQRKAIADRIRAELSAKGFKFEGNPKPAEWHWKRFSPEELSMMYGVKTQES